MNNETTFNILLFFYAHQVIKVGHYLISYKFQEVVNI